MAPRLKNPHQYRPPAIPPSDLGRATTSHDDSGQVYTEVSVAGTSMAIDWKWRTLGSTREHGCFRSMGPGCSSLYNMAVRSALLHSWDITAEVLEEVPERIGTALWNRIVAAQLDSIRLFTAFASTYPSLINHKEHTIPKPNLPLPSYLTPLTSPTYKWLTHLTLLHLTLPRTSLIQLSLVSNLAVLTIGPEVLAPDIGVDDSLLRTWSRSAASTGAFSMLRALVLRGQPHVTERAFAYLSVLPALAIFATESVPGIGPKQKAEALSQGWKYKTGKDLSDWLVKGSAVDSAKWDRIFQALFKLGGKFNEETLTADGVQAIDALPTVHLALGGYATDACVDVAGEHAMRCWYRLGKMVGESHGMGSNARAEVVNQDVRMAPQGFGAAANQAVSQKRALCSGEGNGARKRVKPVMRASKGQDMGDLLLRFGT